jgi:hypothetical protein
MKIKERINQCNALVEMKRDIVMEKAKGGEAVGWDACGENNILAGEKRGNSNVIC